MITKEIYQAAIDSQSAVNLSGIVKSLARDIDAIWAEARANGHGTDWVNQHPIVRLYVEQMVFLNKAGFIDDQDGTYPKAYGAVVDKVAEL